jgi:hypothetical protein
LAVTFKEGQVTKIRISGHALTFRYAQFGTTVPDGMSYGYLSIRYIVNLGEYK